MYENSLCFHLNHDVDVRETGCCIQPNIPWLVASHDGLVSDRSSPTDHFGIVEIKCPYRKRNCTVDEILGDSSFYVSRQKGKLVLKRDHPNGYFTQIQMAMGLAGVGYCDFVVYTFKCLIIIRIDFDIDYFIDLVLNLNEFYKRHLLPKIMDSTPVTEEEELSS